MKKYNTVHLILFFLLLFMTACSDEEKDPEPGTIEPSLDLIDFAEVPLNKPSPIRHLDVLGTNVNQSVTITVSDNFEIAIGNNNFSKQLSVSPTLINNGLRIKVRCFPTTLGALEGQLTFSEKEITTGTIALKGNVVKDIHHISAFDIERLAFGNGHSQQTQKTISFQIDPEKTQKIMMYVKLRCPIEGCNAWDMFGNIRLHDPQTDHWLEIGRFITPYGVDNARLEKGFPIDVTDFKSRLTGEVNLRAFIEVWGADGWLISVDFECIEGTPDFKYYAISPILDYAQHSLAGIPYGEDHNRVLSKCISIPQNTESTAFRTTISGWGHATPTDPDGRPCSEWCFREHHILIDEAPLFTHKLEGIGCNQNPVQPQKGNWEPDRAGWCPGMEVPIRKDMFDLSMAGETFCYKYQLEPWTNDFKSQASNQHAYYALSSFIVVKSNTPIEAPTVD